MAASASDGKDILYARQRGLPDGVIRRDYLLRSIVQPFLTMLGMSVSLCVGGSVVIEKIFSIGGMGSLLTEAVYTLDYLAKTKRYEDFAAKELAEILPNNNLDTDNPTIEISGGVRLNELQQAAIQVACSHRVSMILGGAGSGKTTLVNALTEKYFKDRTLVLAAPTGKAAQNLREHGCCGARTVHSALGKTPNEDFLSPVRWATIRMVVVDEASMLSIEMLAGILCKMPAMCSLVLIGDPNQLGSVGSGNVLPDLLALGFPVTRLTQQYRQAANDNALQYNVTQFPCLTDKDDLKFDKSFKLVPANEKNILAVVKREAAKQYRNGEEIQVITGTNKDVYQLNRVIQEAVNSPLPTKPEITHRGVTVRQNDRVTILRNNREKNCVNGDVGIAKKMTVLKEKDQFADVTIALSGDREAKYLASEIGWDVVLAYAMTAHRSQGSQYDTVIVMLPPKCTKVLRRNFLYTAISRAKKQVILVGSEEALHAAMTTPADPRKSKLVTKAHQKLHFAACARDLYIQ